MEEKDTIEESKQPSSKKKEVVIHIKGLKKSFGDNEVLKHVDLDVHRGENVVILGKSGTGKSVTIECIVGMLSSDEGVVKVFGEDVPEMT